MKFKQTEGIEYGECFWCGQKLVPLVFHHFPIPQSKGDKKGIWICFNCLWKWYYPPTIVVDKREPPEDIKRLLKE